MQEIDLNQQHEELLEFVYLSPFALARIDESGAIDMMNSMGANLLMEFAPTPELTNLLDILDTVDSGIRGLISGFEEERGPICEGYRIPIQRESGEPLVLTLTLLKLRPGRIMAAFGDISNLEAAQRAQRFLLDNVSDGLVTVEASGVMATQCSAALTRWLGAPAPDTKLWDFLADKCPRYAAELQVCWELMLDDVLPLELAIDQLPKRLDVSGIPLGVTYQPLLQNGVLSNVLVVMRDLTAELERERLDAEQRELSAALSRLSQDRESFRSFFEEATRIVESLVTGRATSMAYLARELHTLKGASSLFGLTSVAALCHTFEDRVLSSGTMLEPGEKALLQSRWQQLEQSIRGLLGSDSGGVTWTKTEYAEVYKMMAANGSRHDVLEKLQNLALSPVQGQLVNFAQQAVALGERLEKAPIATTVKADGIRVRKGHFAPFWAAFVHAVRNAVDHGIESANQRAELGKAATAKLEFIASRTAEYIIVELRDDGAGIDWETIRSKANKAGLPCTSKEDLIEALFTDGVSTRDQANETSGRGVGMSALKSACGELGGRIEIETSLGVGTTMRFLFPRDFAKQPSILPPLRASSIPNSSELTI
jgi:two-component system chemotaxis sensor kinase CheA